jgi:hypothetical protein
MKYTRCVIQDKEQHLQQWFYEASGALIAAESLANTTTIHYPK